MRPLLTLKRTSTVWRWLCVLLPLMATSCGNSTDEVDPKPDKGIEQPEIIGPQATAEQALRLEVPALEKGNLFVEHCVEHEGKEVVNYCLEYNVKAHHSRWVAFRFDDITRQRNVSRSDEPFADDPLVPIAYQIGSNGFGTGYFDNDGIYHELSRQKFDRGHLCASADRYLNREANEQTFYMSNMSPQISNFNSPFWSSFEGFVQNRGRDASFADTLYVVKGGTIADGQTLGHVRRNNAARVVVPQYYFMALLRYKAGTYSALAFWMEHRDYEATESLSNRAMSERVVSIDQLEELTGIDFFHNLPDAIEKEVESKVVKSDWGL